MSPFPAERTPEELDNTLINFGKWRGYTPIAISEMKDKRDREYLIWAYENVERKDRPEFCSRALYESVGGKFKSAKVQREEKEAAATAQLPHMPMRGKRAKLEIMDDLDDDIPF